MHDLGVETVESDDYRDRQTVERDEQMTVVLDGGGLILIYNYNIK